MKNLRLAWFFLTIGFALYCINNWESFKPAWLIQFKYPISLFCVFYSVIPLVLFKRSRLKQVPLSYSGVYLMSILMLWAPAISVIFFKEISTIALSLTSIGLGVGLKDLNWVDDRPS